MAKQKSEVLDLIIKVGDVLKEEWQDIQFFYRPNDPPEERCTIFIGDHAGHSRCSLDDAICLLNNTYAKYQRTALMDSLFKFVGKVKNGNRI